MLVGKEGGVFSRCIFRAGALSSKTTSPAAKPRRVATPTRRPWRRTKPARARARARLLRSFPPRVVCVCVGARACERHRPSAGWRAQRPAAAFATRAQPSDELAATIVARGGPCQLRCWNPPLPTGAPLEHGRRSARRGGEAPTYSPAVEERRRRRGGGDQPPSLSRDERRQLHKQAAIAAHAGSLCGSADGASLHAILPPHSAWR